MTGDPFGLAAPREHRFVHVFLWVQTGKPTAEGLVDRKIETRPGSFRHALPASRLSNLFGKVAHRFGDFFAEKDFLRNFITGFCVRGIQHRAMKGQCIRKSVVDKKVLIAIGSAHRFKLNEKMSVHVVSQSGNPSDDTRRVGTGFHSESRGKFPPQLFRWVMPQWEIDQGGIPLLLGFAPNGHLLTKRVFSFKKVSSQKPVTCNSAFLSMEKNPAGLQG